MTVVLGVNGDREHVYSSDGNVEDAVEWAVTASDVKYLNCNFMLILSGGWKIGSHILFVAI